MERLILIDTRVNTNYGMVDGFREDGLNKWFGIPLAKPPASRWRYRLDK